MATTWKAPTWRMPNEKNQSKFESYSLDFDGNNETIQSSAVVLIKSVSLWFKPNSTITTSTSGGCPISFGTTDFRNAIYLGSNFSAIANELITVMDQSTNRSYYAQSGGSISASWHHLAIVHDGTKYQIYLDGLAKTTSGSTSLITSQQILIGARSDSSSYFNGSISQVCIFDYALSEPQVSLLYNSGSPINPMTLKPAPIAYYPLGGNASTGGDSTNTLSVPNIAVPDASVFDFVPNDYINCGQNVVENSSNWTALTVSAWVKKDATGTYGRVIGKDDGGSNRVFILQIQNNETLSGSIRTIGGGAWDNVVTSATIALGEWQHVAMTYLGNGTIKLYINGQQEATDTNTIANLNPVTTDTLIGAKGNISNMFEGEISNVQIWQAELSSTEIQTLYNSGVPLTGTQPQEANLKAWYKLDQSANWEADSLGAWQIPDAVSAYPQSFNFDGTTDCLFSFSPITLNTTEAYTISAWVNLDSTSNQTIISGNASGGTNHFTVPFAIRSVSGSFAALVSFQENSSSIRRQGNNIAKNELTNGWHHVMIVKDGVDCTFYYDGQPNGTSSFTTTPPATINLTTIGKGFNNFMLNGRLSNLQVWQDGLTATDAQTLYNNGTPLTTAIASDNLKAWYKLDNTATFSTNWSIPDASGNGNTGTSSGMTEQNLVNNNVSALNGESSGMDTSNLVTSTLTRQVPYNSYSLNFDSGSSDYIDLGDLSNIGISNASSVSVSLWFNRDTTTNQFLLDLKDGSSRIGLQLYTSNSIYFYVNNKSYFHSTSPSINQWYNLVYVFNGAGATNADKLKMYLNGTELTGGTYSGTIDSAIGAFTSSMTSNIGRIPSTSYFDGKINNVSIFNEALTSTEVLKLYNSGVPGNLSSFNPNPTAWWSLGSDSYFNGSNWICPDLVGSNNGTSTNMDDDALIGNAPNSTGNGTSTNMAIDANLTGSAPNSSNNSFSVNMDYADRETSVPG